MYDAIAELYHLVFEDWNASMARQAAALDGFLRARAIAPPATVLDVSCGIGTQALGLAALGYAVTGSDLSAGAVARAEREAAARGLAIRLCVGDMRACARLHGGGFDVLLTADNSLPHLLDDAAILSALRGFLSCLRPGGWLLIGVRDYRPDDDRTSPQMLPYGFRREGADLYYVFQTREWFGDHYDVHMHFVRHQRAGAPARLVAGKSRYFAIGVDRLCALVHEAEFVDVQRCDDVLPQPLIVARRALGATDRAA